MARINVKQDQLDNLQGLIDLCEGDSRSIEVRSACVAARKLYGLINQADKAEFNVEVVYESIKEMDVFIEDQDEINEVIQSTESVEEHLEKESSKKEDESKNNKA